MDESHARSNRAALLEHARMGRSVSEGGPNGTVIWITPAEIFARYGLDEFVRVKQSGGEPSDHTAGSAGESSRHAEVLMRASDVRNLIRFNARMGMFICPSERAGVVAFLHGYEYAAGGECKFTAALGEHLSRRHLIKPDALGWPHQLARFAERRGLDWLEVYLMVSSEVLSAAAESGASPDSADVEAP
jgi:hypothetical protein